MVVTLNVYMLNCFSAPLRYPGVLAAFAENSSALDCCGTLVKVSWPYVCGSGFGLSPVAVDLFIFLLNSSALDYDSFIIGLKTR